MSSPRLPRFPLTLAAVAATLLLGGVASAQYPGGRPFRPDARGFEIQRSMQAAQARRAASAPTVQSIPRSYRPAEAEPAPTQVEIAMTLPTGAPPASVAIRGPDGELRTFPVEGGQAGLANRVIVVRPGQTVTIQVTPQGTRVNQP